MQAGVPARRAGARAGAQRRPQRQGEPHRACACGGLAQFAGRRPRTTVTVRSEIEIERVYYHCAACGRGFCPRDRALGIDGSHLSPGVLRMVGAVGAAVSFEEGAGLLKELAGISVPTRQVERYAKRLARRPRASSGRSPRRPPVPCRGRCTWARTGPQVPMRREELAGRGSRPAAAPIPAR